MKEKDYPEQILKTLVSIYNKAPGNFHPNMHEFWPELWELAKMAGITTDNEMKDVALGKKGEPEVFKAEIEAPFDELKKRKYIEIEIIEFEGYTEKRILPTPAGIDHGRFLLLAWYKKMWIPLKGDLRTIIVSAITTIVVFFLTYWLSKVFAN